MRRICLVSGMLLGLTGLVPLQPAPLYSTNPPQAGRTKVVPVFIDAGFPAAEQQQILSAIEEWNQALNGVVRLQQVMSPTDPVENVRPWLIRKSAGRDGVREKGRKDQNLATAQPLPLGGGVLIVFAGATDYLKTYGLNLRDVMMRELGHLVGLNHANHTELLAKDYQAGDRSCIDKDTAQEVAQLYGVPLDALNWCDHPGR